MNDTTHKHDKGAACSPSCPINHPEVWAAYRDRMMGIPPPDHSWDWDRTTPAVDAFAVALAKGPFDMYREMMERANRDMERALLGNFPSPSAVYSNTFAAQPLTVEAVMQAPPKRRSPCCGVAEGDACRETCPRLLEAKAKATVDCPTCGWFGTEEGAFKVCGARDRCWKCRTPLRVKREVRRREIDAELAKDAREHPAFATARRAAVMATCEGGPASQPTIDEVRSILRSLRMYEDNRGGGRQPIATQAAADDPVMIAVYERARSL